MACKIVYARDESNQSLIGKRFASHAAVARAIKKDTTVTVQEVTGGYAGWYRVIGNKDDQYTVSVLLTDY